MPHLSTHANLPSPTPLLGWTAEVCKVGGCPYDFLYAWRPQALPTPPPRKCHLMDNPSPARFLAICRAGPHPQRGAASHLCLRRYKGYLFCASQPACFASPLPKPSKRTPPSPPLLPSPPPENPQPVCETTVRFGKERVRWGVGGGGIGRGC